MKFCWFKQWDAQLNIISADQSRLGIQNDLQVFPLSGNLMRPFWWFCWFVSIQSQLHRCRSAFAIWEIIAFVLSVDTLVNVCQKWTQSEKLGHNWTKVETIGQVDTFRQKCMVWDGFNSAGHSLFFPLSALIEDKVCKCPEVLRLFPMVFTKYPNMYFFGVLMILSTF